MDKEGTLVDVRKMGTDPSLCPATSQGAVGTKWITGSSNKYEEKCLHFVGDTVLQQGAQKGCGVSCPGEIKKLSGHNPVQSGICHIISTVLPVTSCTLTYLSRIVTCSRKR